VRIAAKNNLVVVTIDGEQVLSWASTVGLSNGNVVIFTPSGEHFVDNLSVRSVDIQ
jgi:hypothetical protein